MTHLGLLVNFDPLLGSVHKPCSFVVIAYPVHQVSVNEYFPRLTHWRKTPSFELLSHHSRHFQSSVPPPRDFPLYKKRIWSGTRSPTINSGVTLLHGARGKAGWVPRWIQISVVLVQSVKNKRAKLREPCGVASKGPLKGPGGVQGQSPWWGSRGRSPSGSLRTVFSMQEQHFHVSNLYT